MKSWKKNIHLLNNETISYWFSFGNFSRKTKSASKHERQIIYKIPANVGIYHCLVPLKCNKKKQKQNKTVNSVQGLTGCYSTEKVYTCAISVCVWAALMSLFGPQLCVCLRRLKSIRYLLEVRFSLWLWWLHALERPELPTSTSFSPPSEGCEAIRLHRTDAQRAPQHHNTPSSRPRRAQRWVAWGKKKRQKKKKGEGWLSRVGFASRCIMALCVMHLWFIGLFCLFVCFFLFDGWVSL